MRIITSIIFLITINISFAQNQDDVFRYSNHNTYGTSRFTAMGGAFGSVGADISTLHYNPAGLGVFRNGYFSFTPGVTFNSANSKFYDNSSYNAQQKLLLDNVGFVKPFDITDNSVLKQLNFGISLNKKKDFYNTVSISGINNESSLLDVYYNQLTPDGYYYEENDPELFPFSSLLAWNTYLIDFDTSNGQYFKAFNKYGHKQNFKLKTTGDMREFAPSIGANLYNKLFVGATVGIASIDYNSVSEHEEITAIGDTNTYLENFIKTERLNAQATGANLKVGLIYMPSDMFRFSLGYHTPTRYNFVELYETSITGYYNSISVSDYSEGTFEYRIKTPSKLLLGGSFYANKKGLISIDFERTMYDNGRLESFDESFSYENENANVRSFFKSNNLIRLGTEWRIARVYLRAGYINSFNPYRLNGYSAGYSTISGGIGYKQDNYTLDLTVLKTKHQTTNYYLYNPNVAPLEPSTVDANSIRVNLTAGFKF